MVDVATPGAEPDDTWTVAGRTFRSRLIVGTGKYADYAQNAAAAEAAGAEIVTVALRRVNLSDPGKPMLADFLKPERFTYLPNTAGCYTGEDAVRTLRLAREAGGWDLVKLEVLSETQHLLPDMEETLRALKLLVSDGFQVMVYCSDDPVYARKLEDAGAAAIMPAAAPIGSGRGIQNALNLEATHTAADNAEILIAAAAAAFQLAVGSLNPQPNEKRRRRPIHQPGQIPRRQRGPQRRRRRRGRDVDVRGRQAVRRR